MPGQGSGEDHGVTEMKLTTGIWGAASNLPASKSGS
jgi:hypothetical protein